MTATEQRHSIVLHTPTRDSEWWRSAVVYQIYPRSWADANGDGIGDLPGITARLPYLQQLGVDAIWLSPFYPSPQADAGYDVADYRDVEPIFGVLSDADALIARAHELGLRVLVDLVPNHSSDEHDWFKAALASKPGSPERDRYIFRDEPNNWESVFGGPGWTQVPDGQWYLHLFDTKQPDFNWSNPDVQQLFLDTLEFWLDRGVDGFRVDVAHGLVKEAGLPDWDGSLRMLDDGERDVTAHPPMWDQDGVHEIYRCWRKILDSYPGDRAMVAEAWVEPLPRLARYVRADEFQQAFNFHFLSTSWEAAELRDTIAESLEANDAVGAPTTWVLSNHDVVRHASRLAMPADGRGPARLEPSQAVPDAGLGLRRARAASVLMLALPGSAYLYQGEELGLPEVIDLPGDVRQDPTFVRTAGAELGRDGCRVPMPWQKDAPSYGFGPAGVSWLPQPEVYGDLAVDQQAGRDDSTLELYRVLLRLRRERGLGGGGLRQLDLGPELVGYDVETAAGSTRVVLNLGDDSWPIPSGATVLVASERGVTDSLGTDEAVWLA